MYNYRAYNLRIESDIPLPELPPCAAGAEVKVRVLQPEQGPVERSIEWDYANREARFFIPGAGRFLVRGGSEVIVTPETDADSMLLRLYVQGMMLAAILSQRGVFVLHASVVNVNGRAVGLIGPVGSGKSSLASAFHLLGCAVVADDNAAIRVGAESYVTPGFPSLKLYPAVAKALGHRSTDLRPIHDSQPKHAQSVVSGFSAKSLPLECVYSLDRAAASPITRLTPIEAVKELIRHSVPARWGARCEGNHLKMCAALAGTVPVFSVRTFSQLHEISDLARRIHAHCVSQAAAQVYEVAMGQAT